MPRQGPALLRQHRMLQHHRRTRRQALRNLLRMQKQLTALPRKHHNPLHLQQLRDRRKQLEHHRELAEHQRQADQTCFQSRLLRMHCRHGHPHRLPRHRGIAFRARAEIREIMPHREIRQAETCDLETIVATLLIRGITGTTDSSLLRVAAWSDLVTWAMARSVEPHRALSETRRRDRATEIAMVDLTLAGRSLHAELREVLLRIQFEYRPRHQVLIAQMIPDQHRYEIKHRPGLLRPRHLPRSKLRSLR
jgi:hypothetical protein